MNNVFGVVLFIWIGVLWISVIGLLVTTYKNRKLGIGLFDSRIIYDPFGSLSPLYLTDRGLHFQRLLRWCIALFVGTIVLALFIGE